MNELFKTVLTLSVFGFLITLILLCLKPVALTKFSAKWQYYVWVIVLISMTIPFYKFIPQREAFKLKSVIKIEEQVLNKEYEKPEIKANNLNIPFETEGEIESVDFKISLFDLLSLVWLLGVIVFILTVIISYIIYIVRLNKNSVTLNNSQILNNVKNKLNIKRNIRLRVYANINSPMLVGVFFPCVYIPCGEIASDMIKMVFLHELTHYKRKDLLVKWFALFVNAIHWFNPVSYVICANLSEACELLCDSKVTQNMNDEDKRLYMKTILELVE